MVTHADLATVSDKPWNDIVVDAHGNAYVNTIGFEFPGGQPAPGSVALVTPDGAARAVADDLAFPNGMAITADGATLIVAESYANRLTAYDIGHDGRLPPGGRGRTPRGITPTASASTPKAPSGTPTSAIGAACGCARAATSSTPSSSTEAHSPAR